MDTKRVLIMTDSPRIKTGFANIGRHVAEVLHESGRWEVHYVGWFDSDMNKEYSQLPYKLYSTATDKDGKVIREDQYAYMSFGQLHDQIKPDVVLVIGDLWMAAAYQWHFSDKEVRPHKAIMYCPIDSDPVPFETTHGGSPTGQFILNWADHFRRFDEVIAYGKYGMDEINKRCGEKLVTRYIHHGADTQIYHPLDDEAKRNIRRNIFGIDDSDFFVVTVARNQPRKSYPDMMAAMKIFIDKYEQPGRKIKWYCHCPLSDVGWNMPQLAVQNELQHRDMNDRGKPEARVLFDPRLQVGQGPTDAELNLVYNAANLGLFIYTSEGWALPPHEAMAAGIPTIMTGYSAPTDWANGKTLFVKPTLLIPEPITNLRKAYHNPEDIAYAINKIYKNHNDIKNRLVSEGLRFAAENDWPIIQAKWLEYFDSLDIQSKKIQREVIRLSDADVMSSSDVVPISPDIPKVSIIIPTMNGGNMLQGCIDSIANSGWENYEIILVDNGTWDKFSLEKMDEYRGMGIKVVEWRRKYSPSRALNLASAEATGEYILFLDNDTVVHPGAIHRLVECFSNPQVGVATVKMQHPQNPAIFATGFNYDNRLGFTPASDGEGIHQRHAVSGTCMMIPKSLFEMVGRFDESYVFLWQDVDICMKVRALNKAVVCNANGSIIHMGGITRRYMSKAVHTIDYFTLQRKWWPDYSTRKSTDQHRVAVVKLISLGDCTICTRLMKEVRGKYPDSYITLYTTVMYENLFKDNPYIDEIKTVGPVDWSLFGSACSLMLYDAVTFNALSTEAWDTCIEFNQLDHWMEYRREGGSMLQSYANMIDVKIEDDLYDVHLTDAEHKAAEFIDKQFPGEGPLVIMHTTAGWKLKEWPKVNFSEIANRLYDKYGARIYVLGKDADERLESTYTKNIGGQLTLKEQIALMKRATLFIGCDSGPLHMAKAAGDCKIFGMFFSTAADVVGFKGVKNFIAYQGSHCGKVNCGFGQCLMEEEAKKNNKIYIPCNDRASVEDIWITIQKLMDEDNVQLYVKGQNKCRTYFENSEWRTELLEGTDPTDMCRYVGGGSLP